MNSSSPFLINGEIYSDDRGSVYFVNEFNFKNIKRFYVVSNKKKGQFRGWHGHKKEAKYVFVSSGRAKIGAVRINNWQKPSKKNKVHIFKLNSVSPSILYIPPGYANGFKPETNETKITFYSTATLSESKKDDFRFPEEYWRLK